MCDHIHGYSQEEGRSYPIIPLCPLTLKIQKDYKELLSHCSQDELALYAGQFMSIEKSIVEQLQELSRNVDFNSLSTQLQISHDSDSNKLQDWVGFLIQIALKADKVLSIDKQAMSYLSKYDPGAYAQALLYRRACCFENDSVGNFTDNALRYNLSRECEDHALWFLYVEKFPKNPLLRKLGRVTSTPPNHPLE